MEETGMDDAGTQLVVPLIELVIVTILALLGAYIAWQQLRTNRQRLETNHQRAESERHDRALQRQRDLYDRRWCVYAGVLTYLREMTGDLKLETMQRALSELHRIRSEAALPVRVGRPSVPGRVDQTRYSPPQVDA